MPIFFIVISYRSERIQDEIRNIIEKNIIKKYTISIHYLLYIIKNNYIFFIDHLSNISKIKKPPKLGAFLYKN